VEGRGDAALSRAGSVAAYSGRGEHSAFGERRRRFVARQTQKLCRSREGLDRIEQGKQSSQQASAIAASFRHSPQTTRSAGMRRGVGT
jgi:hypothetical protein